MKHCRTAIAAVLLAWLGGCGPGVGGTGTGESDAFATFGATAAAVCSAPFAASLSCSGAITQPGDPILPANQGTLVTRFADLPEGANVSVVIEANSIRLDALCEKIHFIGDWGIAGANDARFFGSWMRDPSPQRLPATLSVQASSSATPGQLALTLRDAAGRVVLGPVTLQRVAAFAAGVAVCP